VPYFHITTPILSPAPANMLISSEHVIYTYVIFIYYNSHDGSSQPWLPPNKENTALTNDAAKQLKTFQSESKRLVRNGDSRGGFAPPTVIQREKPSPAAGDSFLFLLFNFVISEMRLPRPPSTTNTIYES
jgi:hypothetical protein